MNASARTNRFRPRVGPTFLTLLLVALFIKLGLWQLHKAEAKQTLQAQLDRYSTQPPVALPERIENPAEWRYRNVKLIGTYDPRYQILLDNQVDNERAGYHVLTPLKITGSERYILVNRGWIPASAQHSEIPKISTPTAPVEVEGSLWLPSDKIYALAAPLETAHWQSVWQNLDMPRYMKSVPFTLYPVVVRLNAKSTAAGFVRNWPRPSERIETHLGYAYQWFGFAAAAVAIYLFSCFRKVGR